MKTYNENNFFTNTFGIFFPTLLPNREPDYISYRKKPWNWGEYDGVFKPEVSSSYWYTKDGVIRQSSHWGEVSSCFWAMNFKKSPVGFCKWQDFKSIKWYSFDGEIPKEEENYLFEIPTDIVGKNNVAVEFKSLSITTLQNSYPLDWHPNHFSSTVSLVEGLELSEKKLLNLVY